mmetsp:Transcript_43751/g.145766  ORF Transcript_43751/g.145766 Transcript_43751/m.145766 type:complete len:280 (+) Transcript_43751:382-1221(+)
MAGGCSGVGWAAGSAPLSAAGSSAPVWPMRSAVGTARCSRRWAGQQQRRRTPCACRWLRLATPLSHGTWTGSTEETRRRLSTASTPSTQRREAACGSTCSTRALRGTTTSRHGSPPAASPTAQRTTRSEPSSGIATIQHGGMPAACSIRRPRAAHTARTSRRQSRARTTAWPSRRRWCRCRCWRTCPVPLERRGRCRCCCWRWTGCSRTASGQASAASSTCPLAAGSAATSSAGSRSPSRRCLRSRGRASSSWRRPATTAAPRAPSTPPRRARASRLAP